LGSVFIFYAPGLIFSCFEGVRCSFHDLCSRTCFRRNRGRRLPFSCSTLSDSFSAVQRVSGLVFIFCALGLIFDVKCGVGSHFHFLRPRTHFQRYRERRVPFSCFALPDSYSVVPRASRQVLMFCASKLTFGGIVCVRSLFHVLRSRTTFRLYQGHRVQFSCFTHLDLFSSVPRAPNPEFMFFSPGLVFDGTEDVRSNFHVFRS
jgi:hypothetical protein